MLPKSYSGQTFEICYRVRVKVNNTRGFPVRYWLPVDLVGYTECPEDKVQISRETNGFDLVDFMGPQVTKPETSGFKTAAIPT